MQNVEEFDRFDAAANEFRSSVHQLVIDVAYVQPWRGEVLRAEIFLIINDLSISLQFFYYIEIDEGRYSVAVVKLQIQNSDCLLEGLY